MAKKADTRPKRDDAFAKAFGERLKAVRESRGMTQTELAVLLGVKAQNLSRIERGERVPGWQVIMSLAHHLKVTTDELAPKGFVS